MSELRKAPAVDRRVIITDDPTLSRRRRSVLPLVPGQRAPLPPGNTCQQAWRIPGKRCEMEAPGHPQPIASAGDRGRPRTPEGGDIRQGHRRGRQRSNQRDPHSWMQTVGNGGERGGIRRSRSRAFLLIAARSSHRARRHRRRAERGGETVCLQGTLHLLRYRPAGDLAAIFEEALSRLQKASNRPAYNYTLHNAPFDNAYERVYHRHQEIIPRIGIKGGLEWGSDPYMHSTAREDAAAFMKILII